MLILTALPLLFCALVADAQNLVVTVAPVAGTPGSWTVTIGSQSGTATSLSEVASQIQTLGGSSATGYDITVQDSAGATVKSWTTSQSAQLSQDVSSNMEVSGSGSGSDGSSSDGSSGSSSDGSSSDGSSTGSGEGKDGKGNNGKHLGQMKVKCFAADSQVETRQGKMSMEQLFLNPTDVLTVDGQFTPVTMFFHANQDRMTEFNEIRTTESVLKATDGHLIYKEGGEVVSAAKIKTGDFLLNAQMEPVQVLSVQKVTQPGFYAPLTQTGHLMVDGHFVSSYSESETPMIQSLMFNYIQTITNLLPTRITQVIAGVSNPEAAVGFLELSQKFLA